jgi:hypothetical protein
MHSPRPSIPTGRANGSSRSLLSQAQLPASASQLQLLQHLPPTIKALPSDPKELMRQMLLMKRAAAVNRTGATGTAGTGTGGGAGGAGTGPLTGGDGNVGVGLGLMADRFVAVRLQFDSCTLKYVLL